MHLVHRFIVALVVTAACSTGDAPNGTEVGSRDSTGVRIVTNPGSDRLLPLELVWKADLVPPDSALTPVPWGVAADSESGRVYAADWTGTRVAVFDHRGAFLSEYGRAGDGPGEFRNPVGVSLNDDGVLTVLDAGRGILSRWSRDGSFLGEQPSPISFWGPGFSANEQSVTTVTSQQNGLLMVQRLVTVHGEEIRPIYEVPVEFSAMKLSGMSMPAPKVFMPSIIWTSREDTIFVLHGPEYRIDRYESGAPVSSIRRATEPIAATSEMAVAELAMTGGQYRGFMRRTGLTPEQLVDAVGYEEVVSPVQSIVPDGRGRLWVTRTRDGITPGPIDLIDGGGEYVGTLDADGIPVAFLSGSTVVILRQEETGAPVLSLYALEERRR